MNMNKDYFLSYPIEWSHDSLYQSTITTTSNTSKDHNIAMEVFVRRNPDARVYACRYGNSPTLNTFVSSQPLKIGDKVMVDLQGVDRVVEIVKESHLDLNFDGRYSFIKGVVTLDESLKNSNNAVEEIEKEIKIESIKQNNDKIIAETGLSIVQK